MDKRLEIDPTTTAVLVVDMQNDYAHPDGYYAQAGKDCSAIIAAIPRIAQVVDAVRETGGLPIFIQVIVAQPGVMPDIPQLHRVLPKHFQTIGTRLVKGSWGAEVVDGVGYRAGDVLIEKSTYNAFYQTNLELLLRRKSIRTILITGTATHVCCLHAALEAFVRDFDVVAVTDGVATWDPELHRAGLAILEANVARLATADEVLAALRGGAGTPRARIGAAVG